MSPITKSNNRFLGFAIGLNPTYIPTTDGAAIDLQYLLSRIESQQVWQVRRVTILAALLSDRLIRKTSRNSCRFGRVIARSINVPMI